jgi:DNA polymerase-3 subunit gamma/tau
VQIADEMQARSLSFDTALADLASLLLQVALAQSLADAVDDARARELATRIDAESVQLYYQIALQGREDLPLAPDEHAGFVMTVLRLLAFRPEGAPKGVALPKAAKPAPQNSKPTGWPELVQQLAVTGAARELARNAELKQRQASSFELVVPKAKAYLAERSYVDKLKAALEQHLGGAVSLKVSAGEVAGGSVASLEAGERDARRAAAAQAVKSDGFVQDLVNMFDGKIVDSTIRPEGK